MRCIKSRSFAAISAALLLFCSAKSALAAKRPRYGGTLRVELHATSISLDPRQWKPGSLATAENEKLAALVYDRLANLVPPPEGVTRAGALSLNQPMLDAWKLKLELNWDENTSPPVKTWKKVWTTGLGKINGLKGKK